MPIRPWPARRRPGTRFAAGYALHALSGCLDPSITGPGCMMFALIAGHRDDGDTAEQHLAVPADVPIRDAGLDERTYTYRLGDAPR